ncbi:MAG: hypothetical protein IT211_12925 [Armatimonadetes bacterium]|nr:hypothetical protein [Armatimonadota bacterium]
MVEHVSFTVLDIVNLWKQEAISNRFNRYDPGQVAARFLLPTLVSGCGYPLLRFYDPAQMEVARTEYNSSTGCENYSLLPELWQSLNQRKPLQLREDLFVVVMRGSLYPEDHGPEIKRAVQLSASHPCATVIATSYERSDVFVNGELVLQYGVRDWEHRTEELLSLFRPAEGKGTLPTPVCEAEQERRVMEIVETSYRCIAEAFSSGEVQRVLHKNPKKESSMVAAAQTVGYLLLLRASEETYPFERNLLRRFHWAYSGDGREAYGDVGLAGVIWADINRAIRLMSEGEIFYTYLGYKFPDSELRHKLWSMGQMIDNEVVQPALEAIVTERLGMLRGEHIGPALGRLLHKARHADTATTNGIPTERPSIVLTHNGEQRPVTIEELQDFLNNVMKEQAEPAFAAEDTEALSKAIATVRQCSIKEHHTGGPVRIAQAAQILLAFLSRAQNMQADVLAATQLAQGGFLFVNEPIGSTTPLLIDRAKSPDGPYWALCEAGMLGGNYQHPEDAEAAEIALNILNLLHADRSLRYPKLLESVKLRRYVGKWLHTG